MTGLTEFAKQCAESGLEVVDYGKGHWQIRGGVVIVNYYPHAKRGASVYVNGTASKFPIYRPSPENVIAFALGRLPRGKLTERLKPNKIREHKKRLLAKDARCHWCKKPLDRYSASLEHVIPIARGGSNHKDNLKLACRPCNTAHADKVEGTKESKP